MASSRPLPPPEVETRLRAQFGDDVLAFEDQFGHPVVTVTPSRYRELMTFLRDEPEFACDYCDFTSAVDSGDDGIEIVTHLFSTTHHHNVRVKVPLAGRRARLPDDLGRLSDGELARARDDGDVRRHVRGPPAARAACSSPSPSRATRSARTSRSMSRVVKPWPGAAEGEEGGRRGVIAQAGVSFVDQWFDSYWLVLVVEGGDRARVLPRGPARRRLHGAQGAGAHAGPARADVRRTVPRLGAARRRRREVRPEGGHRPRGRGSPGCSRWRRRSRWSRTSSLFVVIPFSDEIFILNLDVGIFFVMAHHVGLA